MRKGFRHFFREDTMQLSGTFLVDATGPKRIEIPYLGQSEPAELSAQISDGAGSTAPLRQVC